MSVDAAALRMKLTAFLAFLVVVVILFNHALGGTTQGVTLTRDEGFTLQESTEPYKICVNLVEPPSGQDLTVIIAAEEFASAKAPNDFQIQPATLTFVDSTNELQQCINITVVDDQIVEPREVFQLVATTSTGESDSQFIILESNNIVTVRLDQERYMVNELDGSFQVCVMLLEGSKIEDENFFVEVSVSVSTEEDVTIGDPVPSTVIINSTTPPSGACVVINIERDGLEEGSESFNVTISADDQPVVIEGDGSASVFIVELCEELAAPMNGSVNVSAREIGSVAMYSCDNRFIIDGDPQRTCQADLQWSGEVPTCLAIVTCEELQPPRNGSVSVSDSSNAARSIANYSCDADFIIVGVSQRICLNTGMWSGEAPNCTLDLSSGLVTTPVTDEITTTTSPCPANIDLDCELKSGTRRRIESRLDDSGNTFEECRANCVDAFDWTPKKGRSRGRRRGRSRGRGRGSGRTRTLNRISENCECYCSRFCPEAQASTDENDEFQCGSSLSDTCRLEGKGISSLKTKEVKKLFKRGIDVEADDCQQQCEEILLQENTPKKKTLQKRRMQCNCFCFYHQVCHSDEEDGYH